MAEYLGIVRGLKLPPISAEKKWTAAAFGYVAFCLLYTLTGNLHLRAPVQLHSSRLDEGLPFIAWTIWIYHSQFFFLALSIAVIRKTAIVSRTLYSMGLASLISFVIFIVYPTTIPRVWQTGAGITGRAFEVLYAIDAATNCLPSLHVALAWTSALGILAERRWWGGLACLWAAMITIATMTTKQHYFVDVVTGLILAAFCWFIITSRLARFSN